MVAAVRLLLVPGLSWALVNACAAWGWLPADPACQLAMLLQVAQSCFSYGRHCSVLMLMQGSKGQAHL